MEITAIRIKADQKELKRTHHQVHKSERFFLALSFPSVDQKHTNISHLQVNGRSQRSKT